MSEEQEIQRLVQIFKTVGCRDPELWATSQIREGIPQFARFIFLKQAWKNIISDNDTSWVDTTIRSAEKYPFEPGASAGPALRRLLAAGASPSDITEIVRVMQWKLLSDLCYQLDDSGVVEYPNQDAPHVYWTLFQVDEQGKPLQAIDGLHESLLELDPTGREMRPKENL